MTRELVLEMEKSGMLLSDRASVFECARAPLVAVTVSVAFPSGALPDALSVSVVLPDPVSDKGLKAAPTPGGSPETANVTWLEKAPRGVTASTKFLLPPGAIVCELGV